MTDSDNEGNIEMQEAVEAYQADTISTGFATQDLEQTWAKEIEKRVTEVESGAVSGIPSARVFEAARRKLREIRSLSP